MYQDFKFAFVAHWQPAGAAFQREIDVADFLIDHRDSLKTALEREQWEKEDQEWLTFEDEETEPQSETEKAIEQQMRNTLEQIRTERKTSNRFWLVGDLVTIRHADLAGVKAIVYQLYERGPGSY